MQLVAAEGQARTPAPLPAETGDAEEPFDEVASLTARPHLFHAIGATALKGEQYAKAALDAECELGWGFE